MAAFKAIPGVNYPPDSGAGQAGVFWFPTSEDPVTVTRSFARTGHWDGIHRPNYQTITSSRVIKVVVKNGVATGVVFVPSSAETADATNMKTVKASKEVIMATGTIHNPQILQNSGIGPKALLKSANIAVQVDLPGVGHNFQDHPYGAGPVYECKPRAQNRPRASLPVNVLICAPLIRHQSHHLPPTVRPDASRKRLLHRVRH